MRKSRTSRKKDEIVQKHRLENVKILHNSDAHYLEKYCRTREFFCTQKARICSRFF
ncbi:MAG: hypothetical protein L6V93_20290 [Clostridiales bacterium]|nr:MAG: hypothetical protein L6V93_20290 [Clostridiales bacterium]